MTGQALPAFLKGTLAAWKKDALAWKAEKLDAPVKELLKHGHAVGCGSSQAKRPARASW